MAIKQILKGHISPETAFVVNDYPYGYTMRCKIRYWLEHHKTRGTRFMSQTTNPRHQGDLDQVNPPDVWNKPKASTYCYLAGAMFINEEGHVKWAGLTQYSNHIQNKEFLETYGKGLPEGLREYVEEWGERQRIYEENKISTLMEGCQR